jgi:hypothetical protein
MSSLPSQEELEVIRNFMADPSTALSVDEDNNLRGIWSYSENNDEHATVVVDTALKQTQGKRELPMHDSVLLRPG